MKLEKIMLFITITLIVLVAAFNVVSTLIMMVLDKNKDIAVLMAMGATTKQVMRIFMIQGVLIGIAGTFDRCNPWNCNFLDHGSLQSNPASTRCIFHSLFAISLAN